MASVSMNFGPQNCGAVPRTSVQDQGAARMIEDYYDFPTGSDFWAVGQSPTRTAIVAANWRGCDVAFGVVCLSHDQAAHDLVARAERGRPQVAQKTGPLIVREDEEACATSPAIETITGIAGMLSAEYDRFKTFRFLQTTTGRATVALEPYPPRGGWRPPRRPMPIAE